MDGKNEIMAVWARAGAALFPGLGKMCKDCAFRAGSDANNDEAAVEAAESCLIADGAFNCHTGEFKDAGRPCAGFIYASKYLTTPEFFKTLKLRK